MVSWSVCMKWRHFKSLFRADLFPIITNLRKMLEAVAVVSWERQHDEGDIGLRGFVYAGREEVQHQNTHEPSIKYLYLPLTQTSRFLIVWYIYSDLLKIVSVVFLYAIQASPSYWEDYKNFADLPDGKWRI